MQAEGPHLLITDKVEMMGNRGTVCLLCRKRVLERVSDVSDHINLRTVHHGQKGPEVCLCVSK